MIKKDLTDLKKVTFDLMQGKQHNPSDDEPIVQRVFQEIQDQVVMLPTQSNTAVESQKEVIMTLQDQEKLLIQKSLERHQGRRKDAADELGISERTLYRKIKEYKL